MTLLLRFLPYIIAAAVVAVLLGLVYRMGYSSGSDSVMAQWSAAKLKQQEVVNEALAKQASEYEVRLAAAKSVGDATVVEVERVRVVTRTIVEKVAVYVPSDTPPLPAGWGVLHDAAARGDPAPEDSAAAIRAYGAGPSAQDAAETVVENYGTYHEIAARLTGLQRYVNEVCLNDSGR